MEGTLIQNGKSCPIHVDTARIFIKLGEMDDFHFSCAKPTLGLLLKHLGSPVLK